MDIFDLTPDQVQTVGAVTAIASSVIMAFAAVAAWRAAASASKSAQMAARKSRPRLVPRRLHLEDVSENSAPPGAKIWWDVHNAGGGPAINSRQRAAVFWFEDGAAKATLWPETKSGVAIWEPDFTSDSYLPVKFTDEIPHPVFVVIRLWWEDEDGDEMGPRTVYGRFDQMVKGEMAHQPDPDQREKFLEAFEKLIVDG